MLSPVLCTWDYVVPDHGLASGLQAWIPPDGCQDWISIATPDGPVQWHLFDLAQRAETATLLPGSVMRGYRLRPGVQIDRTLLHHRGHLLALDDEPSIQALLADAAQGDARAHEALGSLAQASSVQRAAVDLGISARTLERLVLQTTGQPPKFWRSLARIRQTCRSLAAPHALADVAAMHGFTDQPHMNLSFQHWLGCTPGQLRADRERLSLLLAEGYG